MGHNGAGKTTLLRAAVGLLKCSSGKVLFDGEEITKLRPSARVSRGLAYVPQGQQSFGQLTTAENLQVVADGRKNGKQLIDEQLDLFPALKELLTRRAGLLSGGQRQQLAIARALITTPRCLILDEPTEGIQPSVVAEIEARDHRLDPAGRPRGAAGRTAHRLRAGIRAALLHPGGRPGHVQRYRRLGVRSRRPRRHGHLARHFPRVCVFAADTPCDLC